MTSASNRSSFVVFAPSMFYWPGPQRYLHSFPTRRSSDLLIRDADAALNRAKKEGPGKRVRFDESLRSEAIDHLDTASALHRALERDELRVHYQPIIDLSTGEVLRVEALLRWQHPERGLIAPGDFLQVAEDTGLIVAIGI